MSAGSHNDYGARCSRHYGETFMPRCPACQQLTSEYRLFNIAQERDTNE